MEHPKRTWMRTGGRRILGNLQVMELEVEVWEAEGKASCLASISYTTACGRRESHAGVLPCTYTKLVDLDWIGFSVQDPRLLKKTLILKLNGGLGTGSLVSRVKWPNCGYPNCWMCTNLLQLIAKVWAWTRLSPCWRSQEASLSWICFLPAQMLGMRWHVRVCVTAAGAKNFGKLFQVCFIWKGRPCVLAPQSFGYLQVRKKNICFSLLQMRKNVPWTSPNYQDDWFVMIMARWLQTLLQATVCVRSLFEHPQDCEASGFYEEGI